MSKGATGPGSSAGKALYARKAVQLTVAAYGRWEEDFSWRNLEEFNASVAKELEQDVQGFLKKAWTMFLTPLQVDKRALTQTKK